MLRMLFYKSWLETRSRFLWGVLLVLVPIGRAILAASRVMREIDRQLPWVHMSFPRYLWITVYDGSLLAVWTAVAVTLGLAGLRREQSCGVSAFTLSLPVRRGILLWVQAAVGLAEAASLGFVPAIAIPALSHFVGLTFSPEEAFRHAVLLVGTGVVLYGWTFFVSQLADGDIAGISISLSSIGVFFVLVKRVRALDVLDIFDAMTGADMLDQQTFLLHGSLPWASLAITLALLGCMIGLSVIAVERHDF